MRHCSILVIAAALGAALLVSPAAFAGDGSNSAGMRIYRDPVTGEFTSPPAGAPDAASAGLDSGAGALDTSPSGLVEEPGASAAGGMTIDLQGRFRSAESATVDGSGAIRTRCHPGMDGESPR